ncbi:serine acetyltransferase [bacterium]|nr:serine acetyltransferase [bacterium]
MFDNFKEDIDRYAFMDGRSWLYHLVMDQGLWALAQYRYIRWVENKARIPLIYQLLRLVGSVWHKAVQVATGIDIHESAKIGKGLYIGHFSCIFIAGGVIMGEYCNISQGVTLGYAGRGDKRGCPTIGDRVYIAAGAKLIGKANIGNDVVIGANAVVTKDVPDNGVAVGVPARVISNNGSKDFIHFRHRS